MKKRVLPVLLTLVMVLTMLPLTVFAEPDGEPVQAIAAPLSTGAGGTEAATADSVTTTTSEGLTTITATIKKLIPSTHPDVTGNGETYAPSTTGYYVGIALPAPETGHYYVARNTSGSEPTNDKYSYWPDQFNFEQGGENYVSFYDTIPVPSGSSKTTSKEHYMFVKTSMDEGAAVAKYNVVFNVTFEYGEGTPYEAGSIKAANLTTAEGQDAPAYGHASEYGVVYDAATKTIKITAKGLEKTKNSSGDDAYWVGLALPQMANTTYSYYFNNGTVAAFTDADNTQTDGTDTYDTVCWDWSTPEEVKELNRGTLVVKNGSDTSATLVTYNIEFDITLAGSASAEPGDNNIVPVDNTTISGLIAAAAANNGTLAAGDVASVATIKATGSDLDMAAVNVSAANLTDAGTKNVSVALDVEGVGSMTLNPAAATAIATAASDSTVTLEVAKVTFADLEEILEGATADDVLAAFTASVLKDGVDVDFSGTITLNFKTGLPNEKTTADIDVYQDGVKLSSGYTLTNGTLTVTTSHLSEFVVLEGGTAVWPQNNIIIAATTNGTVTTDATDGKAFLGDIVTITATPDSGYAVKEIVVEYTSAISGELMRGVFGPDDAPYEIMMPGAEVTITATFWKVASCVYEEDTPIPINPQEPNKVYYANSIFGGLLKLSGLEADTKYVIQLAKAGAYNAGNCTILVFETSVGETTKNIDVLPSAQGYTVSLYKYTDKSATDVRSLETTNLNATTITAE